MHTLLRLFSALFLGLRFKNVRFLPLSSLFAVSRSKFSSFDIVCRTFVKSVENTSDILSIKS